MPTSRTWYQKLTQPVDMQQALDNGKPPPLSSATALIAAQQLRDMASEEAPEAKRGLHYAADIIEDLSGMVSAAEHARLHKLAKRAWRETFHALRQPIDSDHELRFLDAIGWLKHLNAQLRQHHAQHGTDSGTDSR